MSGSCAPGETLPEARRIPRIPRIPGNSANSGEFRRIPGEFRANSGTLTMIPKPQSPCGFSSGNNANTHPRTCCDILQQIEEVFAFPVGKEDSAPVVPFLCNVVGQSGMTKRFCLCVAQLVICERDCSRNYGIGVRVPELPRIAQNCPQNCPPELPGITESACASHIGVSACASQIGVSRSEFPGITESACASQN